MYIRRKTKILIALGVSIFLLVSAVVGAVLGLTLNKKSEPLQPPQVETKEVKPANPDPEPENPEPESTNTQHEPADTQHEPTNTQHEPTNTQHEPTNTQPDPLPIDSAQNKEFIDSVLNGLKEDLSTEIREGLNEDIRSILEDILSSNDDEDDGEETPAVGISEELKAEMRSALEDILSGDDSILPHNDDPQPEPVEEKDVSDLTSDFFDQINSILNDGGIGSEYNPSLTWDELKAKADRLL